MSAVRVVTNPDMLHTGILPHFTKWMKLFENLCYVVIMPPARRTYTTCGGSLPWRRKREANRHSSSSAPPSIVPIVTAAP
jgi:hypothetical protein